MTLGADFLDELGRRGLRYAHFKYDELQALRGITSADDLQAFFDRYGLEDVRTDGTTADIVDSFLERQKEKANKPDLLGSLGEHPLGCLVMPFVAVLAALFRAAFTPNSDPPRRRVLVFSLSSILSLVLSLIPAGLTYYVLETASAACVAFGVCMAFGLYAAAVAAFDS
jgi:hypothetical protein